MDSMVYGDVDNGLQVKPQRLFPESVTTVLMKRAKGCRKILIPLSGKLFAHHVLGPAIEAARSSSAELILLLVRPPAAEQKVVINQEACFTAFKALQAQIQSNRLRVRLDSVTGATATSIAEYARSNNVDLIVMAGEQGEAEAGAALAQAIRSQTDCPAIIVREN